LILLSLDLPIIALVLVAALMHAGWNALMKVAVDRVVAMVLVNAMCAVLGLILIGATDAPDRNSWPYLAATTAIHQFYFVFLVMAYRAGDLSHVYPIARGSGPLLVALLSGPVIGEALGTGQAIGVIVTSLGIASLALARRDVLRAENLRPVCWALAVGLTIAIYTLVDAQGVRASRSPLGYVGWLFVLNGLCFVFWVAARPLGLFGAAIRQTWPQWLGGGLLTTGAYGITLWCYSMGAVAPIAALRETSVIFAAFLGTRLLGEPFGARRVIAAAVVAIGVIVMSIKL
jgi:drug/metabolite transporter (DMT)-like permease